MASTVLDLRGLKCPLPVLRTRKALRALRQGSELVVLCTDPLAGIDIPHLVRAEGDRLAGLSEDGGTSTFRIVRSGSAMPTDARPLDVTPADARPINSEDRR